MTTEVETDQNYVFVPVRVNGSEPRGFVLDTGASATVLSKRVTDALRLQVTWERAASLGTGESTARLGRSRDVTLSVGGADLRLSSIAVVPLPGLESAVGRSIDGILGAELFSRFVVSIDYAARTVTLSDPDRYEYRGHGAEVPLDIVGHRPFFRAHVTPHAGRPVEGRFVVDTGAAHALGFHTEFVERHGLDSDQPTLPLLARGLSGDSPVLWGRVARFQVGKLTIDSPVARFATATRGSEADRSYDGALGSEVLRRCIAILDYRRHRMILEPGSAWGEPYEFDMSGLRLEAVDDRLGTVTVRQVVKDSPASEAGLREGDVLLAIDERSCSHLGLGEIRRLFRQKGSYLLKARRGTEALQMTIRTRRLI